MWNFASLFQSRDEARRAQMTYRDTSIDSEEHLLPEEGNEKNAVRQIGYTVGPKQAITGLIILALSLVSVFFVGFKARDMELNSRWGSFENGFAEEKIIVPAEIFELTKIKFTGGVEFTAEGEEVLGPSDYVGEPSPEIDAAWLATIVDHHYFSISEEEATKLWGDDREKFRDRVNGGYSGALDMYHCLHCLNQLRRALRRDYYPEEPYRGMVHQLHCIDHLRQVIMCQATSVVSPTAWHHYRGQYIDPRQEHTCRNYDKLQQFSNARINGSIAVPRGPVIKAHTPQ